MSNSKGTKGAFGKSKNTKAWVKTAKSGAIKRCLWRLRLQLHVTGEFSEPTLEEAERLGIKDQADKILLDFHERQKEAREEIMKLFESNPPFEPVDAQE